MCTRFGSSCYFKAIEVCWIACRTQSMSSYKFGSKRQPKQQPKQFFGKRKVKSATASDETRAVAATSQVWNAICFQKSLRFWALEKILGTAKFWRWNKILDAGK